MKPKDLQLELGRFHKVDLPFSYGRIDPQLLDDSETSVALEMLKDLQKSETHFILLGKSETLRPGAYFM